MNRYKLAFGFLAGITLFLIIIYTFTPKTTQPMRGTSALQNTPIKPIQSSVQNIPFSTQPVEILSSTPPIEKNPKPEYLQTILDKITELLTEIQHLMQLLDSSNHYNYAPNSYYYDMVSPTPEITTNYQPQIDRLQADFTQLARQGKRLNRQQTHRFLWEQLLIHGIDSSLGYIILNELVNPELELLEEILHTLSDSSYPASSRETLVYHFLFPNSPPEEQGQLNQRQQRLLEFIEQQLQQETHTGLLLAYLTAYNILLDYLPESQRKVQLFQQLELARLRLTPETFFSFKLQQMDLTSDAEDYRALLQEVSLTPMSKHQQRAFLMQITSQVSSHLNFFNAEERALTNSTLPNETRDVLKNYLQEHLSLPRLRQDSSVDYSDFTQDLYQYAEQVWAIELLDNPQQAHDKFVQRVQQSQNINEQIALLLILPSLGSEIGTRLRQTDLQLRLSQHLQQGELPKPVLNVIDIALHNLDPPQQASPRITLPYLPKASSTSPAEAVGTTREGYYYVTTPDIELRAEQYQPVETHP